MANYVDSFIPELWAATILREKESALVYGALANRNYEGEIRQQGDRVRISQLGSINVNTYTKNSTSALTIQRLSAAESLLDIDQAKYFAYELDDIDRVQSNADLLAEASRKAGYQINLAADQYIAGLYAQAGIQIQSTSLPMTSTNIVSAILSVGQSMDEANVMPEDRWMVIAPWVKTKLVLAGINELTDNSAVWQNGFIGRALGFNFYVSNNVSKGSTAWAQTRIICGSGKESITFAEQLMNVEAYRMTSEGFGQVVKGLNLYGAKIIRPDITACLTASYTAET
jgi:hypothetical protein